MSDLYHDLLHHLNEDRANSYHDITQHVHAIKPDNIQTMPFISQCLMAFEELRKDGYASLLLSVFFYTKKENAPTEVTRKEYKEFPIDTVTVINSYVTSNRPIFFIACITSAGKKYLFKREIELNEHAFIQQQTDSIVQTNKFQRKFGWISLGLGAISTLFIFVTIIQKENEQTDKELEGIKNSMQQIESKITPSQPVPKNPNQAIFPFPFLVDTSRIKGTP